MHLKINDFSSLMQCFLFYYVATEMKTDQMPAWFKKSLWDKFNDGVSV
jgi:hypothetical protein